MSRRAVESGLHQTYHTIGTKKSHQYHGCRLRASLFVSRVPKEYPDQYLRDMVIDVCVEIIELQKVSHDAAIMSFYKFSVWKDDVEKLLQPDAWFKFITCCRFRSHHHDNGRGESK